MFIIGITGGTGAGKTTTLEVIKKLGGLALDCDEIYHELLLNNESLKDELSGCFPGVLVDSEIDRKKLGKLVFSDANALLKLNEITHKYVGENVESRLNDWGQSGGKFAAIDAIALLESNLSKKCAVTVGITAPEELRIRRITQRDGISAQAALQRISAQKPDSFFIENCGHILHNNYDTPEKFEEFCKKYFKNLLLERGIANV